MIASPHLTSPANSPPNPPPNSHPTSSPNSRSASPPNLHPNSRLPSRPTLAQRLVARIERHYALVNEPIRIADARLDFHRIADPDAVLNRMAALESQTPASRVSVHLPYWAQIWPSSLALCRCLAGEYSIAAKVDERQTILDLGCGMGLCGAAAAALGAGSVLMADHISEAILLARLNSIAFGDRVAVRRLDWNSDRLDSRFDRIIGADILYDRSQWDALNKFWKEHLASTGEILLAEPGRPSAEDFPDDARERGWVVALDAAPVPGVVRPVRLIRMRAQ